MTRFAHLSPTRLFVLVAYPLLLLGQACVRADEPPSTPAAQRPPAPPLTPEQRERLEERNRLWQEMQRLRAQGKLAEAVAAVQKVLVIERQILGGKSEDVLSSLYELAGMREEQQEYSAAIEARREALAICSALSGVGAWQTTDARLALSNSELLARLKPEQRSALARVAELNRQVVQLYRQGDDWQGAIASARKALEICGQELGEKHRDYATCLNNLALLYEWVGIYAEAEPLYRKALEIDKQALGEKHPHYAQSLNNLAVLYDSMGNYAEAEPLYRKALEIDKQALGEKHPDYATGLNNLAMLYKSMGDCAKAEPLFRKALEIRRQALGEKHPDYATGLNNLAELYKFMGAYAKAEPLLRKALEIRKQAPGEKHPDYAASLNNLAELYRLMGDYAKAEPLFRKALELHPDYAASLHNLAELYKSIGDDAKAGPLFRKATLAALRQTPGGKHPDFATDLNKAAELCTMTGDYAEAEHLFRKALEIRKQALGEKHPHYANSLNNLALLYQFMGDYAKAEPLFRNALEIRKQALGEKHPDFATGLNTLALLRLARGDAKQAEQLSAQAVEIFRLLADSSAAVQTENQQLANARLLRGYLDSYLTACDGNEAGVAPAYANVLAWKGMVASRQRLLRALRYAHQQDPEVGKLVDELRIATRRLATASGAGAVPRNDRADVQHLEDEAQRLQRELADACPEFAEHWRSRHVQFEDVRKALPARTALVDLLEYEHYLPPANGKGPGRWERRLTAFVVRPERASPERISLGPADPIAKAVADWRSTYGSGVAQAGAADSGTRLRQLIWEPLQPSLAGVHTVLVSPDGAVNRLPLVALPGSKPGTYLLEDDILIAVVPVPQLLPELLAAAGAAQKPAASLLLVGNVDYGTAPEQPDSKDSAAALGGRLRPVRYERLRGTEGEEAVVQKRFNQQFPGARALPLEEGDASKARVCEELPRHRWAHLATHGYFADEKVPSALAIDARDQGPGFASGRGPAGEGGAIGLPPGLLSGLVLAGANRDPGNGVLTALEVSELDLRRLDTAVLSACNTGRGREAGGEGVLGLQRAFQTAGARTVVASLWPVPDRETRDLMETFYLKLWQDGKPKLEALREAQRTMLRTGPRRYLEPADKSPERTPPYYWAAFVLSGDWR
jgi:CHAT domain-containing protein/tetratricopeptide (TPR) repeat protein